MSTRSKSPYTFVTPLVTTDPLSGGSGSNPTAATSDSIGRCSSSGAPTKCRKPLFRPAADDTKPILRDPISRSGLVDTKEAMLRLPPFP